MKIVIAGTINRDIIRFPEGAVVESLGGAIYSILTMAAAAPQDWKIIPAANVGRDVYPQLLKALKSAANVSTEALRQADCLNNAVYLRLQPGCERAEHTDLNLPPIDYEQLAPHLDCGALMLNFTSGFDMEVSSAERAVRACRGLVYIDIHSLSLGIDPSRRRFRRKIPDWRRWISGADFVQLTAGEAWSLHPEDEPAGEDFPAEVGREIARSVNTACFLTEGEKGVRVFTKSGAYTVKAEPVDNPLDTTGCGDVFGAAFLVKYLLSGGLDSALRYGIHCAALKCGFRGIGGLSRLPAAEDFS